MEEKDQELLGRTTGPGRQDSVQERIARLQREIGRGGMVYSPDELAKLERMLDEYEEMLRVLMHR
jgi:hypothetical protein